MAQPTILEGYNDAEKGAYLGAIASLATADRQASQEELEYLAELAQHAQLSDAQLQQVERAATELSGEELQRCLDVLKNSELKYSLIADIITFAKSDTNYTAEEEQKVQQIGEYLGVNNQQFSLLDQFAQNASTQNLDSGGTQEALGLGGLQEKMKNAGINTGGLLKGLLAVAAPILISKMLGGRGAGGGIGGMLGGGLGGMLGSGGLGSLIGMLNGGRGFGGAGGLLGKILGGRGF